LHVALMPRADSTPRCAICHDVVMEGPLQCPGCATLVHAECRVGVPCPTLGCVHAPRSGRLLVVPPPTRATRLRESLERHRRAGAVVLATVLGAVAYTCVSSTPIGSHRARVQADQRQILDAAEMFRLARGRRPATVDELIGPYLGRLPLDPWGEPYILDGRRVLCTGPDTLRGGGDDVWMSR
jgi:hypothetical protein